MSDSNHKVLNLYREQTDAYYNARAAVLKEHGNDLTEGEIVEELARAYTGHTGQRENGTICDMVGETAAENGDPVYSRDELWQIDFQELRDMAAEANTDKVNGRSTKMEIIAYFSCSPCSGE